MTSTLDEAQIGLMIAFNGTVERCDNNYSTGSRPNSAGSETNSNIVSGRVSVKDIGSPGLVLNHQLNFKSNPLYDTALNVLYQIDTKNRSVGAQK